MSGQINGLKSDYVQAQPTGKNLKLLRSNATVLLACHGMAMLYGLRHRLLCLLRPQWLPW
jgi:hypothetical protein